MKTVKRISLAALAAVSLMALSNGAVASASTSEFSASNYPIVAKGADSGTLDSFRAFGVLLECSAPSFRSEEEQTGPFSVLNADVSAAGYCYGTYGNGPMTSTGCDFSFEPDVAPEYSGKFNIGPSGCGPLVIQNAFMNCDWEVEPGTNFNGSATFENDAGSVNIFASADGLRVTMSGSRCPSLYKGDISNGGSWTPDWAVTAENEEGGSEDLKVDWSLVAAYPFEEGAGSTAFDSVGDNDGTISGATWAAGKYGGGALDFDGTDDLVSIADASDLDLTRTFTLETWVNPDTLAHGKSILSKVTTSGGVSGYELEAQVSGVPTGYVADSDTIKGASGTSALSTGTWSHLAFTSDGANLRLYVNGTLVKTSSAIAAKATDANLEIAHSNYWTRYSYFDGRIDQVRIYDEALTQSQIQADMNI